MSPLLLIAALTVAGPADAPPPAPILRPEEAIVAAADDAGTLLRAGVNVSSVRYVWDHDGSTPAQVVLFAAATSMNQAGRVPVQAVGLNGRLVRVDLARLAPKQADLARLVAVWEKFGPLDPSTYIQSPTVERVLTPCEPYMLKGQRYTSRWVEHVKATTTYGPHVQSEAAVLLTAALGTNVPIVRADVFVTKSLSALNGGLYYELRNFAKVDNQVDRDAIFRRFGIDLSDSVSLQVVARAVRTISGVTHKPRAVLTFQGRGGLDNQGLASLTLDFREPTQANRDPNRNLLTLESDAGEAFIERRDGLLDVLLFDGQGELQNVAPQNIAIDPGDPHTGELQVFISCMRCHMSQGPEAQRSWGGWIGVGRELPDSVGSGLDVFGDLSRADQAAAVDEISAAYSADMEKRFRRARDDFASAVLAATGGWEVKQTAVATDKVYSDYEFRPVDAAVACAELGVRVDAAVAAATLGELLPRLPPDGIGVSPEDPYIGRLKAGIPITRRSWEQVLPDAMFRSGFQIERVRNALAARVTDPAGGSVPDGTGR